MITEFGKQLRVIRIRNDELMLDMAKKLGVTPSYLSAIENGKRNVPDNWSTKIGNLYKLSNEEISDLSNAADKSRHFVEINLKHVTEDKKDFAVALAREFEHLDKETIKRLQESLKNSKGEKHKRNV